MIHGVRVRCPAVERSPSVKVTKKIAEKPEGVNKKKREKKEKKEKKKARKR